MMTSKHLLLELVFNLFLYCISIEAYKFFICLLFFFFVFHNCEILFGHVFLANALSLCEVCGT